jgi:hypothetical protein
MANFVGVLAARAAAAGWDVRAEGLRRGSLVLLRVRRDAHVDSEGGGPVRLRHQCHPVDFHRLATSAWTSRRAAPRRIERRTAATTGCSRALVGRHGGFGETGTIDPLAEISAVCREHGLWFHVRRRLWGGAARVPGAPASLAALSQADSIAVDPHKWLYAPLEATGCVLVR